ncbi:hypothetical protein TIFTF001_028709 [Ficus carica]|uniref:Uncharacterized protein n=1 Tax=Ficus carica TaxID=3494 RepID=A0AA88J2A1_FICCA|nr:hypothetical protein TIFTF001_028709 [Ficus carica]
MKVSEITEEKDEEGNSFIDTEAQKEKIRRIIEYQKSLYSSSASSSSSLVASSTLSSSSAHKTNSLINLMRSGRTSLRRLFDMEHTSLATYFEDYSGSPLIKPIPLWGSDSENEIYDPWASINLSRPSNDSGLVRENYVNSECSFENKDFSSQKRIVRTGNRKLTRKKSFRRLPRLPRLGLWKCRGFIFKLRLRKFRFVICRRK